jgi:DNA-binding beta-propeller fold protein YncE
MTAGARAVLVATMLLGSACAGLPAGPPGPAVGPADTLAAVAFGPAFQAARALATDPSGRLYVSDAGRDVVVELDPAGAVLRTLGGPGAGDFAFLGPAGLDPTNGLVLYVADAGNGRIQRFSRERQLLESIRVPDDAEALLARRADAGGRGRPVSVASASTGELFAVEALRAVVLRWDDRRALDRVVGGADAGAGTLREPVAVALAPDGRLFVADGGHHAVLVYDAYGAYLRRIADGTARGVRAVTITRDRLLVTLPDRVLIYGLEGRIDRALAFDLPEALVGAAAVEEGLVLLTPTRLWRARL